MLPPGDADLDYCYLTTTGRKSGQPREIEIWFAEQGDRLYLLSGGQDRSHWGRNIQPEPSVSVRVGSETYRAAARLVEAGTEEDAQARRRLLEKYGPRYSGDLSNWGRTALPVALEPEAG